MILNIKLTIMLKKILLITSIATSSLNIIAQTCATGGCSSTVQTSQYPTNTFSSTSSTWSTVSAFMNAGNWTLFNVTAGQTYEWSYCSDFGGSQSWDAELTLFNNASNSILCYANNCGRSGCSSAPYIAWTATFTGVVKLLTTVSGCLINTGSPYSTLVWRNVSAIGTGNIYGIDVSAFQPNSSINWNQIHTAGKTFAWAKATEGLTYFSNEYLGQISGGLSVGMKMGAYHFANPVTNGATAEANYFLSQAGPEIVSCQLVPLLDLEDYSGYSLTTSMTSSQLSSWCLTWLNRVQAVTGISPIIYANGSVINYLNSTLLNYKIMVADYDGNPNVGPYTNGVWPTWTVKQYSQSGSVSGYSGSLDLDVFNGNIAAFNSFIGCSVATGVKENLGTNSIILFPNPSEDNFTVKNAFNENIIIESISVYDIQGQLALEQAINLQEAHVNISTLSKGMYFISIKTDKGIKVEKLVKK